MDTFFLAVNQWMNAQGALAFLGCFLWGMVAVALSPCHMASIPLVVSYVAGQKRLLQPREAARYAVVFTVGLFITIAAIGAVCAMLGRMLGDVGPYWTILVGLVLLWVACDMMGVPGCRLPGSRLGRLRLRGMWGALVLGLSYGVLSGSCTFGFIAPILAVITIQKKVLTGLGYILFFGLGHCLPIAVAGSFTAFIRKVMANGAFQQGSEWLRRAAGGAIAVLGVYFMVRPFLSS
ncbi:cytochrome c-type biogenesis protein [Desulfacinum hydrothermale DSM 13146]|uniref:Cytochrome c-type biogenesis protein n=1 Tax=Desulfacinum hydrothermale DSM 13146 TaxID=1121390 RepID=A0A1W1XNY5_9BACT|nr:cytochrome c biogenesis protein CcdA [Desulfacinum hydrothermale]SMC25700.1 cytochrome c-type biogenesis protein [Desulfacinum hydrothermale DSM 13146]